jgi:hypothetical protein
MKASLLFAAVLLFASSTAGQQSRRHSAIAQSQGFIQSGGGSGGGEIGFGGSALIYEPPRDFKVQYVTNDGPYVPTSYMNYDDALALGRRQLAQAEEYAKHPSSLSLGEIARAYRTVRVSSQRLEARLTKNNLGSPESCNPSKNNCHRL